MRTNIAAGRAWRPSRFTIAISFSIFSPGAARLAFRYNKPITSLLLLHQTDQFSVEVDGSVLTEALLDSNTADAENGSHVNDADPANFDVIASELRRRRHQLAPFERSDPRHVV